MSNQDAAFDPLGSPHSASVEDTRDPLARVGNFLLELIRKTATRDRQTALQDTHAEEAQASYRKFVDAAAQLQAAHEKVSHLEAALEEKDRELTELKRESEQMLSYLRALLAMIDTNRSAQNE